LIDIASELYSKQGRRLGAALPNWKREQVLLFLHKWGIQNDITNTTMKLVQGGSRYVFWNTKKVVELCSARVNLDFKMPMLPTSYMHLVVW